MPLIHAVNELKFQYYETIIWPVSQIGNVKINDEVKVRLINDTEFEVAAEIARKYQYDRGHFYCDSKYKKEAVDNLYAKWVLSSKNNGASVAIAEYKDKVAGYFVFKMDDLLKTHLGYSYGRLSLLALDGAFRGHGIGKALFSGTMNLIKNMGGEYIDSGYPTKNHISAKLHTMNSFYSVYEELTFHHWL